MHAAAPVDDKEAASNTACKGGHGGLHGTPRTAGGPRCRRPTTQTATRRPRGPAVRPNKGPSLRGWPPWPPCGPCWERALPTKWPRRTREPWLHQRTQRRCRCGTADSRRTRRKTPYGSSRGTCSTASYRPGRRGSRRKGQAEPGPGTRTGERSWTLSGMRPSPWWGRCTGG